MSDQASRMSARGDRAWHAALPLPGYEGVSCLPSLKLLLQNIAASC